MANARTVLGSIVLVLFVAGCTGGKTITKGEPVEFGDTTLTVTGWNQEEIQGQSFLVVTVNLRGLQTQELQKFAESLRNLKAERMGGDTYKNLLKESRQFGIVASNFRVKGKLWKSYKCSGVLPQRYYDYLTIYGRNLSIGNAYAMMEQMQYDVNSIQRFEDLAIFFPVPSDTNDLNLHIRNYSHKSKQPYYVEMSLR